MFNNPYIKVAGAVLNQTPMAWEQNLANILTAIEQAKADQVSVLCLPELCLSGYGCEDMFYSPGVLNTCLDLLAEVEPHTKGMVVSIGMPLSFHNRIFNTAALLVDGAVKGFVAKQFLAGDGVYYEPRWFKAWKAGVVSTYQLPWKKEPVPLGDIYFNVGGVKIGFEICEDAWSANRPGRNLSKVGVDIILNPSASHFAFDKLGVRKRFVQEGARAFGTSYIYANLLGNDAGRVIFDGGTLIATAGKLLAEGPRLTMDQVLLTSAVIDLQETRMLQAQSSLGALMFDKEATEAVAIDFAIETVEPVIAHSVSKDWEKSSYIKEEEFARAQILGLFDYMRKSYSHGVVVSLSGGADSSAIVSLMYLMVKEGVRQLGFEGFKNRLGYFRRIQSAQTEEDILREVVTTAYQATENSGDVTRTAAKKLAEAISATHYELSVDDMFKGYLGAIEDSLGRKLTWEQDDLALQNIQARVRAPSVWMLANIKGALLLSTSNRSEAAVGYATMDGDTSGGLSPIAGIDKAFLRHWLRWLESDGLSGEWTIKALSYVNDQQPTAELRPQTSKQTDEADLMPYELLDAIEEVAIRDKKMPLTVFKIMHVRFPQYSVEQLKAWVERFFRLWCRNQWKRERYAPSFHLDDKNLDPKTWCRFPILSGGFERELAELRHYIPD